MNGIIRSNTVASSQKLPCRPEIHNVAREWKIHVTLDLKSSNHKQKGEKIEKIFFEFVPTWLCRGYCPTEGSVSLFGAGVIWIAASPSGLSPHIGKFCLKRAALGEKQEGYYMVLSRCFSVHQVWKYCLRINYTGAPAFPMMGSLSMFLHELLFEY